jgi:ribosomal protein S18 acetylase RimI-like enzyme
MRWFYPESRDYLDHHPKFVEAFGGAAIDHGTAYEGGDFGGVAMWLPVGAQVDPGPLQAHFEETLDASIRDETFSVLEQMGTYHIEEPHWYLAVIGVDPAQRGKGIGSALLSHSLAPCDEQGLLAYLESSNPANLSLYERHGFEVLGEIQVGSSPPVFPMLRRPK